MKIKITENQLKYIVNEVSDKTPCVKGDCINGDGEWSDGDNHYIGSFKDGKKDSGIQSGSEGDKFFKDGRLVVLRKPEEESGGLIDVILSPLGFFNPATAALTPIMNSLPINARTFLKDLMGSVKMITEKDFNNEEIEALKNIAIIAKKQGRSEITYSDYGVDGSVAAGNTLVKSFTKPLYKLKTTIGRANIGSNSKGEIIISDRYNFNPMNKHQETIIKKIGVTDILNSKLPLYAKMRQIGGKLGSKEGEGAPVYINLGKLS